MDRMDRVVDDEDIEVPMFPISIKDFRMGTPAKVSLAMTHQCNLACMHCYPDAGERLSEELSVGECLELVDTLAKDFGTKMLIITGGEPLLPQVLEKTLAVAERALGHGIKTAVATSGTVITPQVAQRLKALNLDFVDISIDGLADTHNRIRGRPWAFERARNGIQVCVAHELPVVVSLTVMKDSLSEIPQVLELARQWGASIFNFFDLVPCGRAERILPQQEVSPVERAQVFDFFYREIIAQMQRVFHQQDNFFIWRMDPTHWMHYMLARSGSDAQLPNFVTTLLDRYARASGGCGAGRWLLTISAIGEVSPCSYSPYHVGNVRETSLAKLWEENKVFRALRDIKNLKGRCATCVLNTVCRGCRARAFAYTGDYLAGDPGCIAEAAPAPQAAPTSAEMGQSA